MNAIASDPDNIIPMPLNSENLKSVSVWSSPTAGDALDQWLRLANLAAYINSHLQAPGGSIDGPGDGGSGLDVEGVKSLLAATGGEPAAPAAAE